MSFNKFVQSAIVCSFVTSLLMSMGLVVRGECRLDWNRDGFIDGSDYATTDTQGFYAEWYILSGYPSYYPLLFPEGDPSRVDYNRDGQITQDDLMGRLDEALATEGYYTEWYLFMYHPETTYEVFFPETDCHAYLPDCDSACDRLEICGGGDHPTSPLNLAECKTACGLIANQFRGVQEEISGHTFEFRSCVTQDSCEDVSGCGAWLYERDVHDDLCASYCGCSTVGASEDFEGIASELGTSDALHASVPLGYRLSQKRLVVDHRGRSVDYARTYRARTKKWRSHSILEFDEPLSRTQRRQIEQQELILPTFENDSGQLAAPTGVVFVKVSVDFDDLAALYDEAMIHGCSEFETLEFDRRLHRTECGNGRTALELVTALSNITGLKAEADMLREHTSLSFPEDDPNDAYYVNQWNLHNPGSNLSPEGVDARVREAWKILSAEIFAHMPIEDRVLIGVMDTPVDVDHPDFEGRVSLPVITAPGYDWTEALTPPVVLAHGTNVASIIAAATDDGVGGAGICPQCAIKVAARERIETDQEIADMLMELIGTKDEPGVDVINLSWSHRVRFLPEILRSVVAHAENEGRGGAGTLIVVAAGNSPVNTNLRQWFSLEPTVITVAAVGADGLKAGYSAFGESVDIAAPSGDALHTHTMIKGITTATPGPYGFPHPHGFYYMDTFSGTSAAAPHVAGVIGLMLSANPLLSAEHVREYLASSANKIDPVWGQWHQGRSPYYGAGLLDAHVAVKMAMGECNNRSDCLSPPDNCGAECPSGPCDSCRTNENCPDGQVCQALPDMGILTCVAPSVGGTCLPDYVLDNGYCLPTRTACNKCEPEPEICDFRDANCDGQFVHPEDGCHPLAKDRCLQGGKGCLEGEICKNTVCEFPCTSDADCTEDSACMPAPDRYGQIHPVDKVCLVRYKAGCTGFCPLRMSALTDAEYQEFSACIEDSLDLCASDPIAADSCEYILDDALTLP